MWVPLAALATVSAGAVGAAADVGGGSIDVTQLGVAGIVVVAFGIAIKVLWSRLLVAEEEIKRLNEARATDALKALPALERAAAQNLQTTRVIERITQYGAAPRGGGDV